MDYFIKSRAYVRNKINDYFSFLSKQEKADYLKQVRRNFELFRTFTSKAHYWDGQIPALAYDNELLLKHLLLNRRRDLRETIREEAGEKLMAKYKKWERLKHYLADQYSLNRSDRDKGLDSVKQVINELERDLVMQSEKFKSDHREGVTTWKGVKNSLDKHEAAVEFITYNPWNTNNPDSTKYAALVVTPDADQPRFVKLFGKRSLVNLWDAQPVEKSADFINKLYLRDQHGQQLYNLVWAELDTLLHGYKAIYFTPAGLLHRIIFKAIPHPEAPRLMDKYKLVRLNSTRRLARHSPLPNNASITLFGGIHYEYDTTGKEKANEPIRSVKYELNGAEENKRTENKLEYLEGSLDEVKIVGKVIGHKAKKKLLTGMGATESAFKELSGQSPEIIHISTHGFYFPKYHDTANKSDENENKVVFKTADNPLLRSGLAFAGSNYTWQNGCNPYEKENGLLTAYEIAHMNLTSTDLVVLSACETGLGKIRNSEGVYGLQRAFRLAGVDYLIMSLWNVPDEQTKALMATFYKHWYGGMPIRTAFRKAVQKMAEQYSPYFWGGFVLVGGGKAEFEQTQNKRDHVFFSFYWLAGMTTGLLIIMAVMGIWIFRKKIRMGSVG